MTVERTLDRVDEDLAADRRPLARQRLRGLVGSFPARLDLRLRLADLYRRDGDLAQAGRWSWLDAAADPREVAAFETAYRTPLLRMRAIDWVGPEDVAGEPGAERLRALRAEAEVEAGRTLAWERPERPPRSPQTEQTRTGRAVEVGCLVLALVVLVLLLVGAGALVVQGVRVLVDAF